jgi:hypothetical protein
MYAAKNKYHAIRTQNADGTWSDSKKEARIDSKIMLLKYDETVAAIERKIKYPLVVNGVNCGNYICDWTVYRKDGTREVYDAKGVKTTVYKLKKKLVAAIYKIDIIEL